MSLEGSRCGECQEDPCRCKDRCPSCLLYMCACEEEEPTERKVTWAAKRPLSESQYFEEVDEVEEMEGDEEILEHREKDVKRFREALVCEEDYEPDLDVYFAEFNLSAQQRIAMCRTYANYLTQKLRSSGKLGPPRKTPNKK